MPGGKEKDTLEVPADDSGSGRKTPPVGKIVADLEQQQQSTQKYTPTGSQLKTLEITKQNQLHAELADLEKKIQEDNPNVRQIKSLLKYVDGLMAEHHAAHQALQQQLAKEKKLTDLSDEMKTLGDLQKRKYLLFDEAQEIVEANVLPSTSRTGSQADVNPPQLHPAEAIRQLTDLAMDALDTEFHNLDNALNGREDEPVRWNWANVRNAMDDFLKYSDQVITTASLADNLGYVRELLREKSYRLTRKSVFESRVLARVGTPQQQVATDNSQIRDKLPKRQLPKFTGEVREWLGFWAIFRQIHEDPTIRAERKFDYLIQSTVPGSQAYAAVTAYPLCADNYQKAVDALEQRFGRKKTLVKVYVRDLFKLGVDNATPGKQKLNFIDLVTKLTAQIRNLEQLGVTKDSYAEIIYPLVEACLPGHILVAWQRHKDYDEELDKIIDFLQEEVNHETERQLARSQLATTTPSSSKDTEKNKKEEKRKPFPSTAASLLNEAKFEARGCGFCTRNHSTKSCKSAKFLTMESRRIALQKSGLCFVCLQKGHRASSCPDKAEAKCNFCKKKGHIYVMCPSHEEKQENDKAPAATAAPATEVVQNKQRCIPPLQIADTNGFAAWT